MITSRYDGRMGNNMFQIASPIGIAVANKLEYGFESWKYQYYFKNPLPEKKIDIYYKVMERNFHYDQYIISNYNYELNGFFQSWKYFAHCEDIIRKQFEFSPSILNEVKDTYSTALEGKTVAVHVRRGDYLQLSDYHYNLPMDYYRKAMDEFEGNYKFFIFSDGIDWCKQQDWSGRDVLFMDNDEGTDLCLMSQCKNFIIANSSFSWWGAWLSKNKKKKVIAPQKWFAEKKMNKQTHDLLPDTWKRI